jgi:uncharacterized protein YggU (UPF0235/DUF167 family)
MIIKVKAKPNSKEEKFEKLEDGSYVISVKEPAEDNKANIRVINILAKGLSVNHKQIRIKNPKSKEKIVEIEER